MTQEDLLAFRGSKVTINCMLMYRLPALFLVMLGSKYRANPEANIYKIIQELVRDYPEECLEILPRKAPKAREEEAPEKKVRFADTCKVISCSPEGEDIEKVESIKDHKPCKTAEQEGGRSSKDGTTRELCNMSSLGIVGGWVEGHKPMSKLLKPSVWRLLIEAEVAEDAEIKTARDIWFSDTVVPTLDSSRHTVWSAPMGGVGAGRLSTPEVVSSGPPVEVLAFMAGLK